MKKPEPPPPKKSRPNFPPALTIPRNVKVTWSPNSPQVAA